MAGSFRNPLPELKEYLDTKEDLCKGRGPVSVSGGTDSQKVHEMAELGRDFPLKLVVTYSENRAKALYDDYRNFDRNVFLYPARDLLFYSADIQGSLLTRKRLMVLKQLLEEKKGTVITTIDGCMDHLMPLSSFAESIISVEEGQELDLDKLREKLVYMGYERCVQVEQGGQFCIRGGILDIYPLTEENPVRIELWGDEVDSIRSFDVESQRSVERLEVVRLYPARELVLTKDGLEKGIEKLTKEKEACRERLKEQKKLEEAHRLDTIVKEMTEELREGCFLGALDGCIHYFCPETVSFYI